MSKATKKYKRSQKWVPEFRELTPPTPETAIWREAEIQHHNGCVPRRRERPSYLQETYLGGMPESIERLDLHTAMTYGVTPEVITDDFGAGRRDPQGSDGLGAANEESLRPESVFNEGPDWTLLTNTSSVPWRAICYLRIVYENDAKASGTGWMASPDTVITAGHNIISPYGDGWAKSIKVIPGRNGSEAPFRSTHAEEVDALPGWRNGQDQGEDLGVIKLADRDMGRRTGWFGMRELSDADLLSKPLVHSAGYPKGRGATQWVDRARIIEFSNDFLSYRLDTLPGNSGGPIFMKTSDGQRFVIATHVLGSRISNRGLRLQGAAFDAALAWIG